MANNQNKTSDKKPAAAAAAGAGYVVVSTVKYDGQRREAGFESDFAQLDERGIRRLLEAGVIKAKG